jgi:hypothetical protein
LSEQAVLSDVNRFEEDRSENLLYQSNALRQEEIIEEIEVILLSTASLDKDNTPKRQ